MELNVHPSVKGIISECVSVSLAIQILEESVQDVLKVKFIQTVNRSVFYLVALMRLKAMVFVYARRDMANLKLSVRSAQQDSLLLIIIVLVVLLDPPTIV